MASTWEKILEREVIPELQRQESIWGIQRHIPEQWFTILGEEVGEVAMAILALSHNDNPNTTREHDPDYRTELIQIIAICFNWISDIDYKRGRGMMVS